MALGKGIPVINGFDLNSKLPLDSRAVADTMEEMNKLATDGSVGDGQLCYCKADKKLYVLKDGAWSEVGGGASVSPTLNLMDFSGDSPVARTSITEEEKQNIEKGLYNSVFYVDASLGDASFYSSYFSEPALYMDDTFIFSIYKLSLDKTTESVSVTSLRGYGLNIGEKNPDETYPITIESLIEIPFDSGGGGGSSLDIVTINVNEEITEKVYSKVDTSVITSDTRFVLINEKFGANSHTYLLSRMEDSTFGNYYRMPDSLGGVSKGIILDNNGVIKVTALNAVASSSIASLPTDDTTPVIFECNLFTRIGSSIVTLNIGGGDEYISLVKSKSPEMFVSPLKQSGSNYIYYYAKVKDINNMQLYRKTLALSGGVTITFED